MVEDNKKLMEVKKASYQVQEFDSLANGMAPPAPEHSIRPTLRFIQQQNAKKFQPSFFLQGFAPSIEDSNYTTGRYFKQLAEPGLRTLEDFKTIEQVHHAVRNVMRKKHIQMQREESEIWYKVSDDYNVGDFLFVDNNDQLEGWLTRMERTLRVAHINDQHSPVLRAYAFVKRTTW